MNATTLFRVLGDEGRLRLLRLLSRDKNVADAVRHAAGRLYRIKSS